MTEFMLMLKDSPVYRKLRQAAQKRRTSVQAVIRAVIIPSWMQEQKVKKAESVAVQVPKRKRRRH